MKVENVYIKALGLATNEYQLTGKSVSKNKRGECFNYEPIIIGNDFFREIVELAKKKTSVEFQKYVKDEFEFLTAEGKGYDEVLEFKKTHPFWKKEEIILLHEYRLLYFNFVRMFKNSSKTSKNIFSCNQDTCISSIQYHDGQLYVTQRSCDMSCGFFADALTINHFAELTGANIVIWMIAVPHIYANNMKQTIEYYRDVNNINRNFSLNVRKEGNYEN